MSERKAVIKNADMSEDMQQDFIDCATQVSPLLQSASPAPPLLIPHRVSVHAPAVLSQHSLGLCCKAPSCIKVNT